MNGEPPASGRRLDRTRLFILVGGFALLLSGVVLLWYWPFGTGSNVTLSLSARTQVLAFDLVPERPYLWRLPAGTYYGTHRSDLGSDLELSLPDRSALELLGAARATFAMNSRGQLEITVVPDEERPADQRVRGMIRHAGGSMDLSELAHLAFSTRDPATFLRLPIVATNVKIGQLLTDTTSTLDLDVPYQPMLLDGDLRFFARAGTPGHRYLVLDGRIDEADVVAIGEDLAGDIAWMLLTFTATSSAETPSSIDVLLHASVRRVLVTRLHAPEGYYFGVTPWLTLSSIPALKYAWVGIASAILLINFVMGATSFVSSQHDARGTRKLVALPRETPAAPMAIAKEADGASADTDPAAGMSRKVSP